MTLATYITRNAEGNTSVYELHPSVVAQKLEIKLRRLLNEIYCSNCYQALAPKYSHTFSEPTFSGTTRLDLVSATVELSDSRSLSLYYYFDGGEFANQYYTWGGLNLGIDTLLESDYLDDLTLDILLADYNHMADIPDECRLW